MIHSHATIVHYEQAPVAPLPAATDPYVLSPALNPAHTLLPGHLGGKTTSVALDLEKLGIHVPQIGYMDMDEQGNPVEALMKVYTPGVYADLSQAARRSRLGNLTDILEKRKEQRQGGADLLHGPVAVAIRRLMEEGADQHAKYQEPTGAHQLSFTPALAARLFDMHQMTTQRNTKPRAVDAELVRIHHDYYGPGRAAQVETTNDEQRAA